MPPIFPVRASSHVLEEQSSRLFRSSLPAAWSTYKPEDDYGIDFRVNVYEEGEDTGLELLAQLKASETSCGKSYERIKLKKRTYNMMKNKLQVVVLVSFIRFENKLYYVLLKDVPVPNSSHETFTVRIPRENELTLDAWNIIKNYVSYVSKKKLANPSCGL